MTKHWTDSFSFVTGVVRYRDLVYLSLIADDVAARRVSQSIIAVWDDGQWKSADGADRNWNAMSACIAKAPLEQALFLGPRGEVVCIGSGDVHDEQVRGKRHLPTELGDIRGIRSVGEAVYAVGMSRQAYRRDASGQWSEFDHGLSVSPSGDRVTGLEAIDGFDEKEMYAVGWNGEIWHWDETGWSERHGPTNMTLVDVCCAGDGNVYACGRVGTLITGRGDLWQSVERGNMTDDIWSLAWYRDRLYLSTMDGVYTLEDGGARLVDMGPDRPSTCFHLSAGDGVLWSIGAKDVMAFDGKAWTRID